MSRTIENLDYLVEACKHGAYQYTEWIYSILCLTDLPTTKDSKHFPYRLYGGENTYYYFDEESNDPVTILLNSQPLPRNTVMFLLSEQLTITPNDIPSLKEGTLDTTVGRYLFNWYCYAGIFGNRVPYLNESKVSLAKYTASLNPLVVSDPLPGEEDKTQPHQIKVSEFKQALSRQVCFSEFTLINSPSFTPYTMCPAPGIEKKKKELLAKYKDEINNPVIATLVEKELIKYDQEYINQDPNKGFYDTSSKGINQVRKKLHGMYGYVVPMDPSKPPKTIINGLGQGITPEDLPYYFTDIRAGSYARGVSTALGGESVKFLYRIFSAAKVIKEDCHTKVGVKRRITKANAERFYGMYFLVNGESVLFNQENASSFYDKDVIMRTPSTCKATNSPDRPEGRDYCSKCLGEKIRGFESSLASLAAEVGSIMMLISMKKMHGTEPKLVTINIDDVIS